MITNKINEVCPICSKCVEDFELDGSTFKSCSFCETIFNEFGIIISFSSFFEVLKNSIYQN